MLNKSAYRERAILIVSLLVLLQANTLRANVDKVYHPYVEYGTYELEARAVSLTDDGDASDFSIYRFGFGKDISEKLFVEFYVIGAQQTSSRVDVEAYEIEVLYQIGEQGEFWADSGFLMEIEKESESKEWEASFGYLVEKEFGRWSGTLNYFAQYFYENNLRHQWSRDAALQFRYRYSPEFEPGIEVYESENSLAFGPVILGDVKLSRSKIHWEVAFMKETKANGPSSVIRALFEYEF